MFGQGLVKLQERRGEKRAGSWALLQASTRREPATSTARVSSTRVSKQTLHASPLEHLRGGETAIEALTVLSTRALAMEGAWGVTAGCSDAPSPGARLPSIPGTWRQGRRRGQRRRGEPQAAWRGMRHFDAKPSVPWEPFIPHCGGSKRTGSRAKRGRGSRFWPPKKPQQTKVFLATEYT